MDPIENTNTPLRALLVEDSKDDTLIIARTLCQGGYDLTYERVETLEAMRTALNQGAWDVVIADYAMPRFSGPAALELLQESGLDLPFIVVSGTIGEQVAVSMMRAGAHDYLIKDNLTRLAPAVRRELHKAQIRRAHQQARVALRERKELYSALVERAYDGILLVQDQKIIYSNPRLSEVLKDYRVEEILNTPFSRYIHPDELAKVTDYYQRRMAGQAVPSRYETALVNKAGKRIDVEINAGVITYRGQPADFVFVRDISERKRAERLLEALNQAALAMEKALTPQEIFAAVETAFKKLGLTCTVMSTDENQRQLAPIYLSHRSGAVKAAERLTGLQAKAFSIPIESVDLYRKIIRERQTLLVEDTAAVTAELLPGPLRPLARQVIKLLNIPKFIGAPLIVDDHVIGMLSVESADLTQEDVPAVTAFAHQMAAAWRKAQLFEQAQLEIAERKRAETEREQFLAQIQEQARQTQHIVDTVPEGVLLLDAQGRLVLANPPAQAYTAALASTNPEDGALTHLGDRPLAELLAAPPLQSWHAVERDDKRFQVIARPLKVRPQNEGWVMVIRDVTHEWEIQQRAHQQERLAAVGQLAAGIAHDFNNIMAVIVLYTQMALKEPELPTKVQERLETIAQQAWRATELIQQVLDFGRRTVIERRSLDLLPFLKEHVKLLQRTLPEDIQIELAHGSDDYTIDADLTRIQQVIMNLAFNARDAMPKGGQLQIGLERIRVAGDGRRPLPEMAAGEWVQVTVTDSGIGIPPDLLPRIFDPFVTTKPPGQGSGLGLAQVHGIIKLHAGEIDVVSQVGQGSTFTLYFPARVAPATDAPDDEMQDLIHGQGETILVVEDEAATREALVDSLELLGYRVWAVTNGREALDILTARAEEVALLLSDIVMPEMGGLALLRALREQGIQIKALLLTGHPMQHEMENLREQGVIDWLSKPPTLNSLSRAVAEALAV